MDHETRKWLYDLVQAGRAIVDFVSDADFEDFAKHEMLRAAVERKFEIVGEALNRIAKHAPGIAAQFPEHRRIIGFRNILAHGYDVVDVQILWEAAKDHLPILIRQASLLLDE